MGSNLKLLTNQMIVKLKRTLSVHVFLFYKMASFLINVLFSTLFFRIGNDSSNQVFRQTKDVKAILTKQEEEEMQQAKVKTLPEVGQGTTSRGRDDEEGEGVGLKISGRQDLGHSVVWIVAGRSRVYSVVKTAWRQRKGSNLASKTRSLKCKASVV